MTRQELEDRLLDYLYDELEASERSAFERALTAHPEVLREVEAHRATRKGFAALPREVAPAGLLDRVVAEAKQEAARAREARSSPAPAERAEARGGVVAWLRRLVFQPAFAMAMVVLVVAGISLVAGDKGGLPGTPVRSDAQHIPPVAVTSPSMGPAQAERAAGAMNVPGAADGTARAERLTLAFVDGEAEPRAAAAETLEAEAEEAGAPAESEAEPDQAGKVGAGMGAARVATVPEVKKPDAKRPDDAPARGARDQRAGAGTAGGGVVEKLSAVDSKGDLDEETMFELAAALGLDDGGAVEPGAETRRDSNVPELAERRAPETPASEREADDAAPAPEDVSRTVDTRKVEASPKPASRPAEDGEAARGPAKAPTEPKAAPPAPKDPANADEIAEAPAPPPARDPERIATSDRAADKPAKIDDDAKKKEAKPTPTLTPPAPSADKLWQTYRQQAAAGAYADALRSIEALAKVEGESARVKAARAELKKKLAESKEGQGGADKLPPDPPVQPPK